MPALSRRLAAAFALVSLTFGAAATANGFDIIGTKLQVKNPPKTQFQSKDLAIVPPTGSDAPTAVGCSIVIVEVGGGGAAAFYMPAGNWTADSRGGFKYKNREAPTGGQVKSAQIKVGKITVKAAGLGDALGFPLGAVTDDVLFGLACGAVGYCATFPIADVKKNDATQYLNKNPNGVAGCGGSTTSTTTPVTTSTTGPDTTSTTSTTLPTCANGGLACGTSCGGCGFGDCAGDSFATCDVIHVGGGALCINMNACSGGCSSDGNCSGNEVCLGTPFGNVCCQTCP
jgi:hypothetical protein